MIARHFIRLAALCALTSVLCPLSATAQDRRDESFHLPGSFNWQFLKHYEGAARLFNAFDYGHAILYERLLVEDSATAARKLAMDYRYLTGDLLRNPPRFSVPEEAVAPNYAKFAWPAKEMFEWAHVLHRQIYDVYADPRLDDAAKLAKVEQLTDFYLANTKYAFLGDPKGMHLMDDQWFSQRFRREQPEFNGLIWAYHWLQVGLYDPLIEGATQQEREAGVARVVAGFWQMVDGGMATYPATMPMTAEVSPKFAARHPRATAIFDNLHMMHDIISDILAEPSLDRAGKRAEILRQLEEMKRPGTNLMAPGHSHH